MKNSIYLSNLLKKKMWDIITFIYQQPLNDVLTKELTQSMSLKVITCLKYFFTREILHFEKIEDEKLFCDSLSGCLQIIRSMIEFNDPICSSYLVDNQILELLIDFSSKLNLIPNPEVSNYSYMVYNMLSIIYDLITKNSSALKIVKEVWEKNHSYTIGIET